MWFQNTGVGDGKAELTVTPRKSITWARHCQGQQQLPKIHTCRTCKHTKKTWGEANQKQSIIVKYCLKTCWTMKELTCMFILEGILVSLSLLQSLIGSEFSWQPITDCNPLYFLWVLASGNNVDTQNAPIPAGSPRPTSQQMTPRTVSITGPGWFTVTWSGNRKPCQPYHHAWGLELDRP